MTAAPGITTKDLRRRFPRSALVRELGEQRTGAGRSARRDAAAADAIVVGSPRAPTSCVSSTGTSPDGRPSVPTAIDLDGMHPSRRWRGARRRMPASSASGVPSARRPTVLFAGPYTEEGGLDSCSSGLRRSVSGVPELRLVAVPHGRVDSRYLDPAKAAHVFSDTTGSSSGPWRMSCRSGTRSRPLSVPGSAEAEPVRLAAAAGRPYVAAAGAAAAAEVQDGTTGFVVPAGEPETLKAALEALVGDGEEATRLRTQRP